MHTTVIHHKTDCGLIKLVYLLSSEPVFNVVWVIFRFTLCNFVHGFWGWRHVWQSPRWFVLCIYESKSAKG